jgi:hypothetical protein
VAASYAAWEEKYILAGVENTNGNVGKLPSKRVDCVQPTYVQPNQGQHFFNPTKGQQNNTF